MHYLPVLTMSNPHIYYHCYHIKRSDIELYIATRNVPVVTPIIVTLNCLFLTYNVPVVTPSAVVFEM